MYPLVVAAVILTLGYLMSFSDAVNSATTLVLAVTVKKDEPTRFEVVRVDPEPMTRPELMVTGEAPTMLDAVRVVPGPMSKFVVTVSSDP